MGIHDHQNHQNHVSLESTSKAVKTRSATRTYEVVIKQMKAICRTKLWAWLVRMPPHWAISLVPPTCSPPKVQGQARTSKRSSQARAFGCRTSTCLKGPKWGRASGNHKWNIAEYKYSGIKSVCQNSQHYKTWTAQLHHGKHFWISNRW